MASSSDDFSVKSDNSTGDEDGGGDKICLEREDNKEDSDIQQLSPYEELRKERIERNRTRLLELGLLEEDGGGGKSFLSTVGDEATTAGSSAATKTKRSISTTTSKPPRRKSP